MESIDHTAPPVVPIQAEIEALAIQLSELPDNDVVAFLEKLLARMRVRRAVEQRFN